MPENKLVEGILHISGIFHGSKRNAQRNIIDVAQWVDLCEVPEFLLGFGCRRSQLVLFQDSHINLPEGHFWLKTH